MQITLKNTAKLLKQTFIKWKDKDPFRESAIIAFYAIFSTPGLLILIISTTGYFFGEDVVNQNIINQVAITMGADTALQIKNMLVNASQTKSTTFGTIVGVIILLIGATGVFVELQKTFNNIWQVKVIPQKGLFSFLKARLFSFGLIFAIAFLLLISLVVSAALAAMSNWIKADASQAGLTILYVLNFALSIIVISTLFALMFKILPDAKIKWKQVWLGSFVTGLLFTIGKTGLAFYFGKAEPTSIYGAAGSIVLILLWVSYSSMILFFGAEFTAAYAKMYSGKVAPSEIAEAAAPAENYSISKI
jgi:membrane protein